MSRGLTRWEHILIFLLITVVWYECESGANVEPVDEQLSGVWNLAG